MDRSEDPEVTLREAEERIAWVLDNPDMSPWLKAALAACRDRDPIALLNELEILRTILEPQAYARLRLSHAGASGIPTKLHA